MKIGIKRRITQTISLVALNLNFWCVIALQPYCLPVMHCDACALSFLGCPVGLVSRAVAFHAVPWMAIGIFLAAGLLVGRFFCGWICPAGFVQDLLYKIPSPKFHMPRPLDAVKYIFLVVTVVAIPYFIGRDTNWFYCNYCPVGTLEVALPDMIKYKDFAMDYWRIVRFSVVALVIILAVLSSRSFCRVLCPIGAMIALFSRLPSAFRIKIVSDKCIRCAKCDKACPMDVPVMTTQDEKKLINQRAECIGCLSCEQVCPVKVIKNNSHVI